jgi:ABC-type lipoprotein release transport system permease subunit
MLFGITSFDPMIYCVAAVVLLLVVFFSCLAPANRAASVELMQALRSE